MEINIFWTDFSKKELRKIFSYYKDIAGLTIARKIVLGITKEINILKYQPKIGQIEDSLNSNNKEFRYLVFKNYKIIYWINSKNKSIEIFDVFDSRQSPDKINRSK